MENCFKNEIIWLLKKYEDYKIRYCILRNYTNLPEIIGHDIDILIFKEDWDKNLDLIEKMCKFFNLKIYKKVMMPYARRFYFRKFNISYNTEKELILDFHFDEQWLGAVYLTFEYIPKMRLKGMWVAERFIEPLLPFVNFLLSAGGVNKKYFDELVKVAIQNKNELREILELIAGERLGRYIVELIIKRDTKKLIKLKNRFRISVWLQSFKKKPFITIKNCIETCVKIIWYKYVLKNYPP